MKAQFDGTQVLAPPEAKVFYEQNGYGRVEKTGNLRLAVVEALYLIARGKIQIDGWSFDSLLAENAASPGFLRRFIVYRDIRERGFVITTGPQDFRIFPRGQRPGHGQSRYLLRVLSERDIVDLSVILREAQTAANMRKQFLLAVVDDEHELTYYEIRIIHPAAKEGFVLPTSESLPKIPAILAGTPAYVAEDGTGITETLKSSWYGTMLDANRLFLAPVEVCWLLESGRLSLTPEMTAEEYEDLAAAYDPEFADKMIVYRYFRGIGWSPRTGYKYGHHFRVYTEEGKHSEMLVHACANDLSMPMSVISRSVRLAHSVKKKMLFACMEKATVTFIEFARMKL
ncbi:MAG: tRNA-intron lyase [Methanocorpusculum sp.]|uniref:tRNA-intron lyase n=1 Tax=Methanocorpusculum petauri TaxID=3002863 RepID=A0ABT4IH29_9EURY|nr:tRNA-intron lyase [Methanocorpusculum petauri]MDE2443023.1 tRNA-intron lyase [Methanocorpusculum sp.]MDE2518718.1 tRNA-intron lyase [Methanocorpusculum sp.]MDE2522159.1 tRNA-intron lyase [Methanocorpusculum sp.]MDE2525304.1 tRNA-intron lyase [Methanocorpusculum sp.]